MSMTTDIRGGLFGPTEDEEKDLRALNLYKAKLAAASEAKEEAVGAGGDLVGQRKLGRPGTIAASKPKASQEVQAFTKAVLQGKELGEPTSYGGQAPLTAKELETAGQRVTAGQQEFAAPIPVMRGMTTTYQGPRYGEELATTGQAVQAFRREQGAGEYVPPGGALALLQGKTAGVHHMLDAKVKEGNLQTFNEFIMGDEFGRFTQKDPKTGEVSINPVFQPLMLRLKQQAMIDPEGAWQTFTKEAPRVLAEAKHVNEQGIATAMANFTKTHGRPMTAAEQAEVMNPSDDPEAERRRRAWIVKWATSSPGERTPAAGQPVATPPPLRTPARSSVAQSVGLETEPALAGFSAGGAIRGVKEVAQFLEQARQSVPSPLEVGYKAGRGALRGILGTPEEWKKEQEEYQRRLNPLR